MIRISKQGKRPAIKFDAGPNKGKDKLAEETKHLLAEYQAHKNDYDSGKKKFTFKKTLYAHPKIKEALV